jgi:hypothetical protein
LDEVGDRLSALLTDFSRGVTGSEEGARFPKSVVSSSVWAGDVGIADAWALADVKNPTATMKSELERIGFLGSMKCSYEALPLAGHFELHIGMYSPYKAY